MNKILMTALSLIVLVAACNQKTANSSSAQDTDSCKWNESKEYALCTSEVNYGKGNNPPATSFKILDKDENVIKEGTIDNGKVAWFNEDAVEIIQIPGNISEEMDKDDLSKIYVISTKEMLSKKAYLERN